MSESPYDERKLEVLRAACVGQPREMVNLFCAPMKSMTTAQRIEKALDRLRQRYGVSSGLTSEPRVIAIRHGAKVNFAASLLKMYNEDLNTLEVFAYAHDEYNKLSGQLLLDTANRLPSALKRRYLDFLDKNGISLNQLSFESLRKFVVHEINVTTSDYAQAFFKSEDKKKSREPQSGRSEFRVRQVAWIREYVLIMEVPSLLCLRLPVGVEHLQITIVGPRRLMGALLFVLFVRGLTIDTILSSARSL